jgi:hypothetical protein
MNMHNYQRNANECSTNHRCACHIHLCITICNIRACVWSTIRLSLINEARLTNDSDCQVFPTEWHERQTVDGQLSRDFTSRATPRASNRHRQSHVHSHINHVYLNRLKYTVVVSRAVHFKVHSSLT